MAGVQTWEYTKVGRPYGREPLGTEWILRQFP
jgi:hypothetical protein